MHTRLTFCDFKDRMISIQKKDLDGMAGRVWSTKSSFEDDYERRCG